MARIAQQQVRSDGDQIIKQGEPGDGFYVVVEGQVRVTLAETGDTEVARITEGGFFGEMALLSDQRRSASVWSIGTTTLLFFIREHFLPILTTNPRLRELLGGVASKREEDNLWSVLFGDDEVQQTIAELDEGTHELTQIAVAAASEETQTATSVPGEPTLASNSQQVVGPDSAAFGAAEVEAMAAKVAGEDDTHVNVVPTPAVTRQPALSDHVEEPARRGFGAHARVLLNAGQGMVRRSVQPLVGRPDAIAVALSVSFSLGIGIASVVSTMADSDPPQPLCAGAPSAEPAGAAGQLPELPPEPLPDTRDYVAAADQLTDTSPPITSAAGGIPSDASANTESEEPALPPDEANAHEQAAVGLNTDNAGLQAPLPPTKVDTTPPTAPAAEVANKDTAAPAPTPERKELRKALLGAHTSGDYKRALEAGYRLRSLYTLDWESEFVLAETERKAGLLQEAIASYRLFAEHNPTNIYADDALFHSAEILQSLGQKQKAKELYRQVADNPKSDFRDSAAKRVQEIQ